MFTNSISRIVSLVANGFAQIRQFIRLDQAVAGVQVALSAIASVFFTILTRIRTNVSIIFGGITTIV